MTAADGRTDRAEGAEWSQARPDAHFCFDLLCGQRLLVSMCSGLVKGQKSKGATAAGQATQAVRGVKKNMEQVVVTARRANSQHPRRLLLAFGGVAVVRWDTIEDGQDYFRLARSATCPALPNRNGAGDEQRPDVGRK